MSQFDLEMQRALEADGEKLRQLTGEDHGPFCPSCLGLGCIEGSSDQGDVWTCDDCNGTGKATEQPQP